MEIKVTDSFQALNNIHILLIYRPQSAKTRLRVKIGFGARNSSLGPVEDAQSEILVKSRNTCHKTGYITGVSESIE